MAWYPTMVFYFGIFDAGLIMCGGLIVAWLHSILRAGTLAKCLSELVQR
jgi:hypothetical protein